MAQGSFSAKMSAWARETKERMHAVRASAVQDMVAVMQTPGPSVANPGGGAGGAMPIDTGFLRASLVALPGVNLPMIRDNPNPDGKFGYDGSQINLTIAEVDFDTPLTLAYTAAYARKVEERYAFVRLAAQRWPQVVEQQCAQAKAAVASRGG